jgi:hypothetical protein
MCLHMTVASLLKKRGRGECLSLCPQAMPLDVYACILYVSICIPWYMFVYACIQYVYARICMYVQVCAIKDAQAEECNGLTDDGVSSYVLADDSGIAAQIN